MGKKRPCSILICRFLSWGRTRYIVIPWNYIPLSLKTIMVSQNLYCCRGKVTHFVKYLTVTVKIIPSSFNFSSLCRENKAFNYTLISWKIRSVLSIQYSANQNEWNKTNSLQAVKQALLRGWKIISDAHDASKMATLHAKNREKLPHGFMGRLHNPPLSFLFI